MLFIVSGIGAEISLSFTSGRSSRSSTFHSSGTNAITEEPTITVCLLSGANTRTGLRPWRGETSRYAIVGLGIHLQTGRVSGLRGATQVIGETRLAAASIVSPLVKAALPEGLYKSVDSSLRKSLPVGLYKAIRLLGKEIMLYRLHRAGVKRAKAYAEKRGLKLNIGCGPNRKEGWINIDLSPRG
jgi:hypothetical protein